MSQYIISDEAIQDLDDISDYFLQTNVEAGEQFLKAFNVRCQQLANFPSIGRSYAHIRQDLRTWLYHHLSSQPATKHI